MTHAKILGGIVIIILIAGGSFWGGTQYQKSKVPATGTERGAGQGFGGSNGQGRRAGQNGGFVNGTILSKDATSITIQMMQGGTRIVLYSSSTQIGKAVPGTPSDLVIGQTISAQGTSNQDGSMTAEMIQIRPAGAAFLGRSATSSRQQ